MSAYRGRFAPSPTGLLHLGSAATALFCAAAALRAKGSLVLRVEDIDFARVIPGALEKILDDLRWLGVRFQEGPGIGGQFGPYIQSERLSFYQGALDRLAKDGLTYLCDCSRADIARVASAPHAGEEGPRYPGTCRRFGMQTRSFKRPPAVRLAVPDDERAIVTTNDLILGTTVEHVGEVTGDFILRRGDGVFAYQLAVVVDDLAMEITDVVRGRDLATSSARQALLAHLLGHAPPRFAHVPLLVADAERRLAKREPGMSLEDQRKSGRDPRKLGRAIARAYGHALEDKDDPVEALADTLEWSKLPAHHVRVAALLGDTTIEATPLR